MTPSPQAEIRQLLLRGDFPGAEALARRTLADGLDPQTQILLAAALAKQNRFDEGLVPLRQGLDNDQTNIEGWNWLSICLRNLNRLKEAEEACLTAIRIKPDDAGSNFNLGLVYMMAADYPQAAKYLSLALQVHPQNAQIVQNLGLAFEGMGDEEKALACYRQAVQLAPNAPEPLLTLASLAMRRSDAQEALTAATGVLKLAPESVLALVLAARANFVLDRPKDAEACIARILEFDPGNSMAYAVQGLQKQFLGDFEGAAASYRKSIELNRRQGISYWGILQGRKAGPEDAVALPEFLKLAEDPRIEAFERAHLYYSAGKISDDTGDYKGALEHYDRANALSAATTAVVRNFNEAAYRAGFARNKAIFTSSFLEAHRDLGNPTARPIFVVGMIRSGTTLMEQILSCHPDVYGAGELRFWVNRGRECLDLVAGRLDPAKAKVLAEEYMQLLTSLDSVTERVTDKTPENLEMLGLLNILFPNAKIVNMNRNPVDNCLSIYTIPYSSPPDYAYVRRHIAIAYEEHAGLAEHWRQALPEDTMIDVSYEQLTADPEPTIRTVLTHLNLPWADQCLKPQDNKRTVLTPSLWQARQPIYRSSRERWRNYNGLLPEFENL
ncbi:MAG: tetratricopeptide repeat-containing sulfotransferase family protein [Fimbriimonadaceae bacterium]